LCNFSKTLSQIWNYLVVLSRFDHVVPIPLAFYSSLLISLFAEFFLLFLIKQISNSPNDQFYIWSKLFNILVLFDLLYLNAAWFLVDAFKRLKLNGWSPSWVVFFGFYFLVLQVINFHPEINNCSPFFHPHWLYNLHQSY